MRDLRDTIHNMDNDFLINHFKSASEFSLNDEFIQILLMEIKNRDITLEDVLKDVLH